MVNVEAALGYQRESIVRRDNVDVVQGATDAIPHN